mmetsp:Transcript_15229/g.39586  ORF Transcript_15229/g.39586 Transcript_15229/m.39586 type:complete len:266 (+) Transcript_15229:123-920(+)
MEDPFQVVKDEVQHSLSVVNELHKRWKEIYKSAAGTDTEEYEWTKSELLSGLRSIEWDLQDLEETIGIVQGNREKFGLSDDEIESRKQFVDGTRSSIATIRAEVNGAEAGETSSKSTTSASKRAVKKLGTERESLLAGDSAAAEAGTSKLTSIKVDTAAHADNSRFIADEAQKQQFIMKEQDSQLDVISSSVTRLKDMGHEINTELKVQDKLLDEIDEKTESARTQMGAAMKGLTKLAKDSDKGKMCLILILSLILIGLCYAIFS